MKHFALISLVAFIILMGTCWVTNRFAPHWVPDSPSYTEYSFESAEAIATQIRTPGYPVLVRFTKALANSGADQAFWANQTLVILHIALQAIAVGLLAVELAGWNFSRQTIVIAACVFAIGCTFWDHVNTIATDAPAMSLAAMIGIGVLRIWRTGLTPRLCITLGILTTLVIALRPAYLFLIPWLMLSVFVRPGVTFSRRWAPAIAVGALPLIALMAWCTFRLITVDDLGVLPFGHQNMAAVTTQLLDADELEALPGRLGELGKEIADRRIEMAAGAQVAADGLDLRPRADAAPRADSYTTIENRWDAMTYMIVIPAAEAVASRTSTKLAPSPGLQRVHQHQMLAELDRTIVRSYPVRYLRWIMLAIRRGVWGSVADMLMHPIFFVVTMGLAVAACIASIRFRPTQTAEPFREHASTQTGLAALTWLALSYWLFKIAFVSLTSPPIGRFSDAAAVWLPVWIAVVLVSRCCPKPHTTP
ncbi:putative signal peptide and transmembrane protein [Rhodopirellula islandica]|uniref:Signal peptide and transmembrane protein n=1 Tax=Rhodopirellula islandica TaxID=595434 RepID=A0A0J1BDS1_RHOIS|nr:hypothetical protein [Rhodopirellula islandica]KLU04768.1 putative signal peptide and transmembrane protein [Rhodopirellula islandica]